MPFLFCYVTLAFAQKHDAFSFFGYENGSLNPAFGGGTIDFNFQPPRIYKETKKIDFYSYCGSCSDSTGHLQFYTNGISIQNRDHKLMEGGDSLNFSDFWVEFEEDGYPVGTGARIVPAPGKPNQYYLFSMGGRYEPSTDQIVLAPLWYSRIDMNQNGGLGRVEEKNVVLMDVPLQEFVFVKHGNGRDWWLLCSRLNQNIHYTFLINEAGVNGPFVQEFGPVFTELESSSFCNTSPDGSLYLRNDSYKRLSIYDFDRCTGKLDNLRIIPFVAGFNCITANFSPDSRRLYLNTSRALLSMDMTVSDPVSTLDTIATFDGFSTPLPLTTGFWVGQDHEDGKIYYSTTNGTLALHVMHHPGLPGLAADFEQHGIKLPTYNSGTMCRFPNYRLGKLEGSPCDTLQYRGPASGFTDVPYRPSDMGSSQQYRVLSPLRGNGKPQGQQLDMIESGLLRAREAKKAKAKNNDKYRDNQ